MLHDKVCSAVSVYQYYFDTFKLCVVQYSQFDTYIFMICIILIVTPMLYDAVCSVVR